jgi:hypothetical protein
MVINYATLHNEIINDPLSLGYAPYASGGNDWGIANLLNNKVGAGTGVVGLPSMAKTDFFLAIIPAINSLPLLSGSVQTKWDRILSIIGASDTITNNPIVQSLLTQSASDGLWSGAQASGVFNRVGSRAEVLFGANTQLTALDIAASFGRVP